MKFSSRGCDRCNCPFVYQMSGQDPCLREARPQRPVLLIGWQSVVAFIAPHRLDADRILPMRPMTAAFGVPPVPHDRRPAAGTSIAQNQRMKQKKNRQRNKKKFAAAGTDPRSKALTVKVKPKEEEPCTTRNPQPKILAPE